MRLFGKSSHKHPKVGVQIAPEGIALARVFRHAGRPLLEHGEFLPHTERPDPAASLGSCVQRLALEKQGCHIVLAPDDYQLLLVDAPAVPHDELRDALRWRIQDLIDFPASEAAIDAFLVPLDKSRATQRMAYVAVAHRSVIVQSLERIRASKLVPVTIDIPELARRNLMETCCDTERGLALVTLSPGRGHLQIVRDGEVFLTRQFVLPYDGELEEPLPTEALVLELQRSFDYFERQMRQPPPAQIYLLGEQVTGGKVTEALKAAFPMKLDLFQLPSSFVAHARLDGPLSPSCLDAVGAALRAGEA